MSNLIAEPVQGEDVASNARVIENDRDAILTAKELATGFAAEANLRDRERRLPYNEIELYSRSGLWGITIPKEYGGADISTATLAEVTAIISEADSSLGQIPQNHFYMLQVVRSNGTEAQKRFFFERVIKGERLGNALSETGTKTVGEYNTRIDRDGDEYVVNGTKFYSTGALFAHWIPVVAKDEKDYLFVAFVRVGTPGLTVIDDWSSFGQRTTGSGTTVLDNVRVPALNVLSYQGAFDEPTALGPVGQIIHAAVEIGIARAAVAETIKFVRERARPWIDANVEHGYEDPLTISQVGDLVIRLHSAEALIERAGRLTDKVVRTPDLDTLARASVAVAEAKAASTEAALQATNKLFELSGTQSTLSKYNLDRHWRNARAHTLHDPVRWKYYAIGNYYLNGVRPPRHGAI
jgi:SfnB family sulfur acquisition oxidoreductase